MSLYQNGVSNSTSLPSTLLTNSFDYNVFVPQMSRMIISGLEHSSRSGADNLRTAGERFSTNDSGFGRYNHMEVTTDSKDIVPGYLIRNKYQVIGILGEGTFGKVCVYAY